MKLSIIIPVYNEEDKVLRAVSNVLSLVINKEIIVVDDGSTDASYNLLKDVPGIRLIKHVKNMGKGAAFRTGMLAATGDYAIPYDADCEYDASDILKCVQPVIDGKATVVYGSRRLDKTNTQYSGLSFYIGGVGITWATNILYGSHLTDEPTCLKLVPTKLLREIKIEENGFEWEPAITSKILKRGINIYEVPIRYYPRHKNEGKKIAWRDGFKAISILLKYRVIK